MNERQKTIMKHIEQSGSIKLLQLKHIFPEISEMTLRRDLSYLESLGLIKRVYGGAILIKSMKNEYDFHERMLTNIDAKKAIGSKALEYLDENRSIFLDAGSTILAFVEQIPDIKLYSITNAPNIALELMKRRNAETIMLGGSLNRSTMSLTGLIAINNLNFVNIDIAFISAGGFSVDNGFTHPNIYECELKKGVINSAKKVIVLMDASKMGKDLPFTFAKPRDVNILITDQQPPADITKALQSQGVEVIIAK